MSILDESNQTQMQDPGTVTGHDLVDLGFVSKETRGWCCGFETENSGGPYVFI
jgi:hypothetical protein